MAEPGQKRSGYFTFHSDPGLATYQWPYFGIVGARGGPTALVTAGRGAPDIVSPPRTPNRFDWLHSRHEGIFHCRVRVGGRVTAGQVAGEMVDLLGNRLVDVAAQIDGAMLFVVTSPAIKREGLLLGIGVSE
jgi:hypothetical protein